MNPRFKAGDRVRTDDPSLPAVMRRTFLVLTSHGSQAGGFWYSLRAEGDPPDAGSFMIGETNLVVA